MRGATPFTRHRFGGRGRSVVELEMGWGEGASRSLVERILTALLPALSAGEMEIAQVVSGDRRSRKAKLDISKVGAAIETSGGDSIWLSGRPGRGYASLIVGRNVTRSCGDAARVQSDARARARLDL